MTGRRFWGAGICGAGALAVITACAAFADDDLGGAIDHDRSAQVDEGSKSTLTYSIGMEGGRNLDLVPGSDSSSLRLNGGLGYVYRLQTRQTTLTFNAAISPETDKSAHQNGVYPDVGVTLEHEMPRTKLTFSAGYVRTKVTDQSLGYDQTGAIVEYNGAGQRALSYVTAGIEGGVDMPLGYTLSVDHRELSYSGMSDDGLGYSPSNSTTVKGGLRADVSAMTQFNLDVSHNRYSSGGDIGTLRQTDSATLGVTQRFDAVTSGTFYLGRERVDTSRDIGPDDNQNGTVYGLSLKREDGLGHYNAAFDRSITETGPRDRFTLGRDSQTTIGKFSGDVGVSKGDSGTTDMIGDLSYEARLPRDTLTLSLARDVYTDDLGADVVVTRLDGSVSHALSAVNALEFGVTATSLDYTNSNQLRVDGSISYVHDLTTQTSLQAGVRVGLSQQSAEPDADSQSLFLTLTRKIESPN